MLISPALFDELWSFQDEYVALEGLQWHKLLQDLSQTLRGVHLTVLLLRQPTSNLLTPEDQKNDADARLLAFLEISSRLVTLIGDCNRLNPEMKIGYDDLGIPYPTTPPLAS